MLGYRSGRSIRSDLPKKAIHAAKWRVVRYRSAARERPATAAASTIGHRDWGAATASGSGDAACRGGKTYNRAAMYGTVGQVKLPAHMTASRPTRLCVTKK